MGNGAAKVDSTEWVTKLPKVELHVHFDGSFDAGILYTAWKEQGADLNVPDDVKQKLDSCEDLDAFRAILTTTNQRSLQHMLDCFAIFTPIVAGNYELLEKLAYQFFIGQAEQNVYYTEVRYNPHFLDGDNHNPEPVFEAITKGLRRGHREHPDIVVNQILCCIDPFPQWSADIVEMAKQHQESWPCAVVGVDIAAGENYLSALQGLGGSDTHKDYNLHLEAMKMAQDAGLNITVHAGEVGGIENVMYAVKDLGATRIGHGYAVTDEASAKELVELVNEKIHFEVCPTSSFETGGWKGTAAENKQWQDHPIKTMIEAGASVSINSDDPTVFATSIIKDYLLVLDEVGISKKQILKVMHSSIKASFAPAPQKLAIMKRLRQFEKKYRS